MRSILILVFCFAMQFPMFSAVERDGFRVEEDTAQYKGSDYANVVHVERDITLEEAFEIAENHSEIDYFVYLKGGTMVLELPSGVRYDPSNDPYGLVENTGYPWGHCRVFHHGDVVFFKKEGMWLGSAPGLADTYIKESAE